MMDWYSWLSNTTLDPSLVSEYAVLFSRNELDEPDITHFDHQLLQCMGISIAKHRLEILKLARKHSHNHHPAASLAGLLAKTKKCLVRCVRNLAISTKKCRSSSLGAMVVVPNKANGGVDGRWRAATPRGMKRSMKPRVVLMLTAGGRPSPLMSRSPMVYDDPKSAGAGEDDGFWKGGGGEPEHIRWDSMFQGMKPT